MSVEEYITQSRAEGNQNTNEYSNGIDYTLITEPDGRITISPDTLYCYKQATDESLKNEIIEYALHRIGSTRIGLLDGMTLIYQDRWYNIYVENGVATVEEV